MAAHSRPRAKTKCKRNGARRFWTKDTTPDHDPVIINARDLAVLRHLSEHRLLDTKLIHKLMGGSYRALARRLRQLALNGYIDRPSAQINYYQGGAGSDHLVIALSTKGARTLTHLSDTPYARHLTRKNTRIRRPFIDHTLATARFMVDLECSCRTNGNTHLLGSQSVLARAPYQTRSQNRATMGWHTRINDGRTLERVAIIPDKMFSILNATTDDVAHFCLETDRNSMPIVSNSLKRSSIKRKILAYREVFRTRSHERVFGWANMRVIIETTTSEHAENIKQCIRDVYGNHKTGMLLITTEQQTADQNLFDLEFETAFGQSARLF